MSLDRFERLRALDKSESPSDEAAREVLRALIVEEHRGLVVAVAEEMCKVLGFHAGNDLEDLIGEGNLALVRAVDRFDCERGVPFANYAGRAIDGALRQYKRDKSAIIREPAWHQEKRAKTGEVAPVVGLSAGLPGQSDGDGATSALDRGHCDDELEISASEARLVLGQFLDWLEREAYELSGGCRDNLLKQHAIMKLHFDGLAGAEIALKLRVSETNVFYHLRHGRARLAVWIEDGE